MSLNWDNTSRDTASDKMRCDLFATEKVSVREQVVRGTGSQPVASIHVLVSEIRKTGSSRIFSTFVESCRRISGFFWAGVKRGWAKVGRILDYLLLAESREPDAWLRDDYILARMILARAFSGHSKPYEQAFRAKYGTSPERALAFWAERDAATQLYMTPRKQPEGVKELAKEKKAGAE